MNAKGHIAVGITTGMTVGVVASYNQGIIGTVIATALGGGFSLLTSQLPDIDSEKSKISQKIPIIKILTDVKTTIFLVLGALISLGILATSFRTLNANQIKIILIPIVLLIIQSVIKASFSHRKITHTLLMNGLLSGMFLYPYFATGAKDVFMLYAALGLISGLFAHLFYDTITVRGCPLLYPFIKKNLAPLKFLKLKSGKYDKGGIVFSVGILLTIIILRIMINLGLLQIPIIKT